MADYTIHSISDNSDEDTSAPKLQPEGYYKGSMHLNIPAPPDNTLPGNLESVILSREGSKDDSISPKGAIGRHQIMPGTAVPYLFPGMPNDKASQDRARQLLFDPSINSQVGHRIISDLWNKYHDPMAVMVAYNAGPGRADAWLASGKDPKSIPEETQKYIGVGNTGKAGSPGWYASPDAIDSENRKSNTSVKYMDPLQYLSLLPPLDNDDATKAKGENLKQSLLKGDNIESLPSLEVESRGDDLKIVDSDGRNRAQAAVDAGVNQIPVAINGAQENKDYKNLIGKKKLDYNEFKSVPSSTVSQDVAKFAPNSIPNINPGQLQEQTRAQAQPQIPQPQVPISNPVPSKPDYYPQIVAGVNNDIYNPRGIGYRGTGVPDLATNATASGRINAANSTSAGQVGLTPSSPASSMMNMLSNLNPIGSAQAAENPYTVQSISNNDNNTNPYTVQSVSDNEARPTPQGYIPHVPGLDTIAPPLANALMSPAVNLAGDIAGLFSKPNSMNAFMNSRANTINRLNIPETPVGQAISSIIDSPARLVGWAAEKILGEDLANKVKPYATIATDVLAPLALASSPIRNALARPVGPTLNRLAPSSREFRAARAIEKQQPKELAAGGMSKAEMQTKLSEAHAAGIPLTPADLAIEGGPQDRLLGYALEHSPEAIADSRKFLTERIEGVPSSPSAEPIGGSLERMTNLTEKHLGSGSAIDMHDALDKSLTTNKAKLKKIEKNSILNPTARSARTINRLKIQIAKDDLNKHSLNFGQNVLKDSTHVEDIDKFIKYLRGRGTPEALEHLKVGLSDTLRDEYRKVRQEGKEPSKVNLPQKVQNKVSAVFGYDRAAADDFFSKVKMEDTISNKSKNILSRIKREGYISDSDKRQLHMVVESIGHLIAAPLAAHFGALGIGIYGSYWLLKAGRLLYNMSTTGGGIAARRYGREIAAARLNPNPNALSQMPSRRAPAPVANMNALAQGGIVPAGVLSGATNNQPSTRFVTPQEMTQ